MTSESIAEECHLCEQILKPRRAIKKKDTRKLPKAIESYLAFGKAVCMHNPKTRYTSGKYRSAIGPQLKRQWDYVVAHSKDVYERYQNNPEQSDKEYEIFPTMSEEMLEKHFLEHIDDAEIQSTRNRLFMADACRRKRQTIEHLWEADRAETDQDDETQDEKQKEHMNDYMKYQKMYASMTQEGGSRTANKEM